MVLLGAGSFWRRSSLKLVSNPEVSICRSRTCCWSPDVLDTDNCWVHLNLINNYPAARTQSTRVESLILPTNVTHRDTPRWLKESDSHVLLRFELHNSHHCWYRASGPVLVSLVERFPNLQRNVPVTLPMCFIFTRNEHYKLSRMFAWTVSERSTSPELNPILLGFPQAKSFHLYANGW